MMAKIALSILLLWGVGCLLGIAALARMLLRRLMSLRRINEQEYGRVDSGKLESWKGLQRTSTILFLLACLVVFMGFLPGMLKSLGVVFNSRSLEMPAALCGSLPYYPYIMLTLIALPLLAGGWYEAQAKQLREEAGIEWPKKRDKSKTDDSP